MMLKAIAERFNALVEAKERTIPGTAVSIRENVSVSGDDAYKALEKAISCSCDGVLVVDVELLSGWLFNNELGMNDCSVGCFYYLASDKESLLLVATKKVGSRAKCLFPFVLSLSAINGLSVAYNKAR